MEVYTMWLTLLPVLLNTLPGIVQGVETLFSHKAKSGPEKRVAAVALTQYGLQIAGHIPAPTKDEKIISIIGELVDLAVADLNQQGVLGKTGTTSKG
jgi:hypothetical protein